MERPLTDASAPGPHPLGTGRRNLRALSLASFLTDVASEMVAHLVPLYLTAVLGVGAAVVGLVEGVAASIASLVKAAAGRLSDRLGRRKSLVVIGYGLSALARPMLALATTSWAVAATRWSDRLGKGIRTAPRDALLAAGTAPHERGRAFGLHRAADTAGAVVGIAVAVWLLGGANSLDGPTFHRIVLVAAVPGFLAVLTILAFVRDLPARPVVAPSDSRQGLPREFWMILALCALFDLGDPSEAFLVLRATELGATPGSALGLMLLANTAYALLATPFGRWSDRVGRSTVLGIGWLLHAVVYGALALTSAAWLPAVLLLHGVRSALLAGATKAVVADLVPVQRRGAAYGILAGTLGVLDLPASLLLGILWDLQGAALAFGVAGGLGSLAALLLFIARRAVVPSSTRHHEDPR